ncbi:ethylbenzene dehydrogenase-related protein [Immundisolibacter sp.]|uniref:ethylbenzene dehydrogenase-related protein n=1 Tax=Immundisolibacter sp. TaxID=1934948 RepID=UPI003564BC80
MEIKRVAADAAALLDPANAVWQQATAQDFPMVPTPLKNNPAIEAISPFIAQSTDHGVIHGLTAAGLHNGTVLALRLSWASEQHDTIADLDQFVDGVAVMFPLTAKASAVTMGSPGEPVNAWYWKADKAEQPFDVVAEGYGTSERRSGKDARLVSKSLYQGGRWHVVLQRPLDIGNTHAQFQPGTPTKLAFGVWDGGNRERAGRKSFSGDFVLVPVAT